ncbi:MAG: hypothetical protein D6683_15820 [Actinomyces sp.]|nr:MAG: hypothetical protein D6683_15820 [Actinomyces sp.]
METMVRRPAVAAPAWIRNPAWDLALALAWVPFVVAAELWRGDPDRIVWLVGATLLFSVSHQPLTLPLVYGDGAVFGARRRLFTLSPVIFLAAVVVGRHLDPVVIAVVAGAWNAGHTLQQRYGIARIYGRKAGQSDGRVEHALLWALLVFALLWAAADPATPDRVAAAGLGGRNQQGLAVLTDLAPVARVAVVPVLVLVGVLALVWVRQELASPRVNPAKWLYLASSVALFGVILVEPLAGFVGYVGAHAAEYFLVVHRHLGDRYPDPVTDGGAPLGRAVRSRPGPTGVIVAYAVLVVTAIYAIGHFFGPEVFATVFLTLGALHLFYDGLIWKLRRPEVARGFSIPSPPASPPSPTSSPSSSFS